MVTSIRFFIISKKVGIVFHSVFVMDFIPDFISPSRINDSGFVLSKIFSISFAVSVTDVFFPK